MSNNDPEDDDGYEYGVLVYLDGGGVAFVGKESRGMALASVGETLSVVSACRAAILAGNAAPTKDVWCFTRKAAMMTVDPGAGMGKDGGIKDVDIPVGGFAVTSIIGAVLAKRKKDDEERWRGGS